MVLVLSESAKLAVGTWMFIRAVFQAGVTYFESEKAARNAPPPKGRGVGTEGELQGKIPSHIEIKKAIPKHCFQPKISTSMYFCVKDFVLIAIFYAAILYIHQIDNTFMYVTSLVLYWAINGTLFTAVFVVGHDCGHGSFSHSSLLNDIVGTLTHAFLLVPYYPWKLSHHRHHKFTGNFDKDEVFYPVRKSEPCSQNKVLPGFGFGIGWFGYMAIGYSPRNVPHFNPFHEFFKGHVLHCLSTFVVWGVWAFCLYQYYLYAGFMAWFNYYFMPMFIFSCYMVIITFLHHSEINVPWYADSQWEYILGQLSSIDRHYGMVHNIIHNIGTHQMHHMFIKIPHYHLEEATRNFRQAFPHLVRQCEEPILPSYLRMFRKYEKQSVIEDDCQKHVYT